MLNVRILCLAFCVLATICIWWLPNRTVELPPGLQKIDGVSYTPFRRWQSPDSTSQPSDADIKEDLTQLASRTRTVRTYAMRGPQGRTATLARAMGVNVLPGAWIGKKGVLNSQEVTGLADLLRQEPDIEHALVGNESILRGDVTVPQLIAEIRQVRGLTNTAVGSAEPWHVWLKHPRLAAEVDYLGVQILPYWEGLPVQQAAAYALQRLSELQRAYPGKPIIVTEVGWPSRGRTIGGAIASRANQALFLRTILPALEEAGITYFVIEAFDQPWKIADEGLAGAYWGLWHADRTEKYVWAGDVDERPEWWLWMSVAVIAGFLFASFASRHRWDMEPAGDIVLTVLSAAAGSAIAWPLMTLSQTYSSLSGNTVWIVLFAGQIFLFLILFVDMRELAERLWRKGQRTAPITPCGPATFPKVSVHVPCSNEPPEMVCQTLLALAQLDYPDYEVIVIDNNTADPTMWQPVQEACGQLGDKFRFYHLEKLDGFKGGALQFALSITAVDSEIIAVVDSDYAVLPNWLREAIPHFEDPNVGFVQTPQDYRDRDRSRFKRFCFWEYASFFKIGMVVRNWSNAIIQHGTMTLIRRQALDSVGGWSLWCITEDAELGLRLHTAGWRSVYVEKTYGHGLTPDDAPSYRTQRYRWVYGAMGTMRHHWRDLFKPSRLEPEQRYQYVAGWLPWIADAAGFVFMIGALVWTAALVLWPHATEFPPAAFPLTAISVFFLRHGRDMYLYRRCVPCRTADWLGAVLAGMALTHTVAIAVLSGLTTKRRPFYRTPKGSSERPVSEIRPAVVEWGLLVVLIVAIAAVAAQFGFQQKEPLLWMALLFVQAIPYGATMLLCVLNTLDRKTQSGLRLE